MRVVCPYVTLAPGVAEALDATGHPWEAIYVGDSDEAYWELFAQLWAKGETWINVEHDVIVQPGTLDELASCSYAWCTYSVAYMTGAYSGLACAKFDAALITAIPDALDRVAKLCDGGHPPKHWCRMDAWLQDRILPSTNFHRHYHSPLLDHYRPNGAEPWPSHGCIDH